MTASRSHSRAATIVTRVFRLGGDQGVGIRSSHAMPGSAGPGGASGSSAAPPSPEGSARPPALFERGQAGAGSDVVEPGAHRRPALERAV